MSWFSASSASEAIDNRQNSGAEGINFQGRNNTSGRDEAFVLGNLSSYLSSGSTQVQGNVTVKPGGTLNIENSDSAIVNRALSSVENLAKGSIDSLKNFLVSFQDKAAKESAASMAMTQEALEKVTDLSETKLTDGESGRNETVLKVILGVLVAAVLIVIFGKKKSS